MSAADQHGSTSFGPGTALLVNAWVVTDGNQEQFIERIEQLFEHLRTLDGFLEGAVLRGVNPTRFISYMRLRSVRDRQRIFDHSETENFLRAVEGIAHADLQSYDVLLSYRADAAAAASGAPVSDASR
jgi:heme-degrading monooxygenase HmoA